MARKKRTEEHDNHERWLVSYADFVTLLFALFVVMYSISSVNEGKYRVLSDAMVAAFRNPARSLEPIQIGGLLRTWQQSDIAFDYNRSAIEIFQVPFSDKSFGTPVDDKSQEKMQSGPLERTEQALDDGGRKLADSIERAVSQLVGKGLVEVRRSKRWIEVEIKSSVLFSSGNAELSAESEPVLRELAKTLKPLHNMIHVEGFTDNVPINNFEYRSNWELSAARAASVVHLFTSRGVDPQRMAAIGYGEFRPVDTNDTPEGRARNRRVVVVIMSGTGTLISQPPGHLQTTREGTFQTPGDRALMTQTATVQTLTPASAAPVRGQYREGPDDIQ